MRLRGWTGKCDNVINVNVMYLYLYMYVSGVHRPERTPGDREQNGLTSEVPRGALGVCQTLLQCPRYWG